MDAILKFLPNRVRRLYLGGSGIDRMRGETNPADGYYPEDWIASCIEGNTREFQAPGHGLSKVRIDGEEVRFADLLKKYPAELLGEAHFARYGANPAVLTKFLDSAIRLPVQVHPTVPDAKRYFHADFGKTEAWIILACRPGAYVYCGFNETLDEAVFRRESLAGVYERGLGMMHKIPVKPGDVVIVWGGLPHAIGPGITMVEVMEPSDLTINPEARCGEREIAPQKRFGGLAPETALDIFEYKPRSEAEIRALSLPKPVPLAPGWNRLIDREKVHFFEAQELRIDGERKVEFPEECFHIALCVEGKISIDGVPLSAGESAFLPFVRRQCALAGNGRLVLILPPSPAK